MKSLRTLSLAFITTLLFSGCAATVERLGPDASPIARPAEGADKHVSLSMQRTDDEQPAEDWAAFRLEWKEAMDELAAENDRIFTFVGDDGTAQPPTGVLLKARVNSFRYVSPGKRYAVGVMTGNASMDVDVEFIETPSGRVLGKRRYATTSHTMEGIFSAMTPKQVQATAREIWQELRP